MRRFFKSASFKIFAVVLAALIAGSAFATFSRSGSAPLTAVTSVLFGPVQRLSAYIASTLAELPISFRSSSVLAQEVNDLQAEIDAMRSQLADYEQIKKENENYKDLLELKESNPDYQFAEASIIGRDASNHFGSFILNKGSAAGIAVNDPVVYGYDSVVDGAMLVGVVTSVTLTQCTVSTLFDPNINVSCYEIRTRDLGFVTTTVELAEDGLCKMPGLASATAIAPGGVICTSGIGGIYPRDLVIGTVNEIVPGDVDISMSAIITPGAPFEELTDVFVITHFNGQGATN